MTARMHPINTLLNRYYTPIHNTRHLTVRLLEPAPRSLSSELLRLAATRVRDDQRPIVAQQNVLDLVLALLIHVLLVERHQSLGNSLTQRIRLAHATSSLDPKPNINLREPLLSQQQDRLHDLPAEGVRLDDVERGSVEPDLSLAPLHVGDRHGGFLTTERLDRLRMDMEDGGGVSRRA